MFTDMQDENKTDRKEYSRKYYNKYYSIPENRFKNRLNMRLNYWRKKYCEKFSVTKEEIMNLTEHQLRKDIEVGFRNGKIE